MKKHSSLFAMALLLCLGLCSCVTVKRARNLILSGDKVSAIELLCKMIIGKKDEAEAISLFIEIYPSTVEEMKPQESVGQIRKDFAAKYSTTEIQAIKKCGESCSSIKNILSHPDIANVIRKGESVVLAYSGLARIKRAVSVLPRTLYDENSGEHEVVKYTDDFAGMYNESKRSLAEFYYNIPEAFYPGKDIQERIWLIDFYKRSDLTYGGLGQAGPKCAELCYLNGQESERLNTVEGNKEAIFWYQNASVWVRNYKDSDSRVQIISYEIAMVLLGQARTKEDFKEAIKYLSYAGNYKDAAEQILEVKYHLAYIYRNERTLASYAEAGRLFEELGNYKNAPYESALYGFYKRLVSLSKGAYYASDSLSSGSYSKFSVSRNLTPNGDGTGRLLIRAATSDFGVYLPSMEKIIYPGALLDGDTIASQSFLPFAYASRLPIDCHLNFDGRTLAKGSLSNPNDGILSTKEVRRMASQCASYLGADCDYEFQKIYSLEDLAISTGMGAARDKVSYALNSYNWNSEKSCTLIKVRQKFYSANVDPPQFPFDFFAVDQKTATASMLKSVAPYYVSSVDYGRQAYFVVCSDLTSEEIVKDFISARPRDSKNKGSSGMRANPDISAKWAKNGTTIRSITVSEKIYSVSDLDGIFNWIKLGTSMSLDVNSMVPIAFALRNLSDNSYAVLSSSKTCLVRLPQEKTPSQQTPAPSGGSSGTGNSSNGGGSTVQTPTETPGSSQTQNSEQTENQNQGQPPYSSQETAALINGTQVPASAYNGDTSLIFVGKKGYYKCSSISVESGSGVKTYYYDIPASEIELCVASWSDSEFGAVMVNGISMLKNKTVYSFRDVSGNTISLDTVDSSGKRIHNLLLVRKR